MQEFTKFSFELPSDRTDLIDIANFLVEKSKKFKDEQDDTINFENIKNEVIADIFENPKNRAVFERLRDK